MITASGCQDVTLVFGYPFLYISPFSGDFDRRVGSLGAAGHGDEFIITEELQVTRYSRRSTLITQDLPRAIASRVCRNKGCGKADSQQLQPPLLLLLLPQFPGGRGPY